MAPTLQEYDNIFSFQNFHCWAQDFSHFIEKSLLSVCAVEASDFHLNLVYAEYWTRLLRLFVPPNLIFINKSEFCVHYWPRFFLPEGDL